MGKRKREGDGLNLGDRMKDYEYVVRRPLMKRIPVIIRVDGVAFHTLTRKLYARKYSGLFSAMMTSTAVQVMKKIGCKFCYSQSDEISFLLTDYKTIKTDPWFNYDVEKLTSVTAGYTSSIFSACLNYENVSFAGVAFNVPQDDVCNYFLWRQIDATRNAIQMAGREYFSHKQLHKVSCSEINEMLFQEHKVNFSHYPITRRRGFCIINGDLDKSIPIFSKDRNYIEKHVFVRED